MDICVKMHGTREKNMSATLTIAAITNFIILKFSSTFIMSNKHKTTHSKSRQIENANFALLFIKVPPII